MLILDKSAKHQQHKARSVEKQQKLNINKGLQTWLKRNWKLCKSKQQIVVIDIIQKSS